MFKMIKAIKIKEGTWLAYDINAEIVEITQGSPFSYKDLIKLTKSEALELAHAILNLEEKDA